MVLATVRDEKFSDFSDEPSEWDKLETAKYSEFWEKFSRYSLPEADDSAEISLLSATTRTANIEASTSDFQLIANKNDGTFSNLVENLRMVRNQHLPLQANVFRDTLKGTWEKRYQDALLNNLFAKNYYDAVDLARSAKLPLTLFNLFSIGNILSKERFKKLYFVRNLKTLQTLIKKENILNPRDGQIEAKGYKIDVRIYLPRLYKLISYNANNMESGWRFFIDQLFTTFMHIPISALSTENVSTLDKFWALFFDLGYNLNLLGDAYGKQGFQEIEVLCYKKSISLSKWSITNPRRIRLGIRQWINLGYSYQKQQKYNDALAAFQKAIELDPKDAYPWNGLGNVYRDLKQTDEARAAYQKAIELNPKEASPWNNLGLVYRDLKQTDEARAAYQKAIELNPKDAYSWDRLGLIYNLQKDYKKAVGAYRKAVELEPENGTFRSSLVAALHRLKRDDEATQQAEIARKLIEKESEYNRACFEAICGNIDEALALLKIALENQEVSLDWARQDPDFDNLRDDPRFKELVGLE